MEIYIMAFNSKSNKTVQLANGFLNLVSRRTSGKEVRIGIPLFKKPTRARDLWMKPLLKQAKKQQKIYAAFEKLSKAERKAYVKKHGGEPQKYFTIEVEAYVVNTGGSKKEDTSEW